MDNSNQEAEQFIFKYKLLKLHALYVFTMLTLFLAFVMSDRWTESEEFTTYLTNVATFVSLVLGLVAIFYSFISNSSLSQSLGNITKVSDEIVLTKEKLGEFLSESNNLTKVGNANTEILKDVSISVSNHVQSLNEALAKITEQTDRLQDSVSAIPLRLDKLENNVIEATNEGISKIKDSAPAAKVSPASGSSPLPAGKFIKHSSISGLWLLYACLLAHKSNKDLSLVELHSKFNVSTLEYLHGYYVAVYAADYIDSTDVEGKDKTFKITKILTDFDHVLKEQLITRIDSIFKVNPDTKKDWLNKVEALEKFYS